MMNKLFPLVTLMISSLFTFGQTQFNLTFDNGIHYLDEDSLTIDILISFDALGKLGTSNLVFTYDPNSLSPQSFQTEVSNPLYTFTLIESQLGRSSYNVMLAAPNSGEEIPSSPTGMKLVTLSWQVIDPNGDLSIQWYEDGTKGTVVFLDDESTLIPSGALTDFDGLGTILPVEWLSFDAKQQGSNIQLNWLTAQEQNNEGFWIERSRDGNIFDRIDFEPSLGDSETPQAYEWVDPTAYGQANVIYYRLAQIDFDGTSSLSKVRSVILESTELSQVKVHPMDLAAGEEIQVELILPETTQAKLELYNSAGKVVRAESEEVQADLLQQVTFPTQSIAPGIYFLMISGTQGIYHTTPIRVR